MGWTTPAGGKDSCASSTYYSIVLRIVLQMGLPLSAPNKQQPGTRTCLLQAGASPSCCLLGADLRRGVRGPERAHACAASQVVPHSSPHFGTNGPERTVALAIPTDVFIWAAEYIETTHAQLVSFSTVFFQKNCAFAAFGENSSQSEQTGKYFPEPGRGALI